MRGRYRGYKAATEAFYVPGIRSIVSIDRVSVNWYAFSAAVTVLCNALYFPRSLKFRPDAGRQNHPVPVIQSSDRTNGQYRACLSMTSVCTLTVSLVFSHAHLDVWILLVDRIFQPRQVCPIKVEQIQCTGTYCIKVSIQCRTH